MSATSLLASLALRLSSHPENIATESLLHVLKTHRSAAVALGSFLENGGLPAFPLLYFRSQVSGEAGSIPDIVGSDSDGRERLIIEAKFWAHLTDHQPQTYLNRLAIDVPSILLFIGPQARQHSLWELLLSRVPVERVDRTSIRDGDLLLSCALGRNCWIAVASWRAVLMSLNADAIARGQHDYQSDIEQIVGLCERMDSEAFLPVRPSELSQEIGRRVQQYAELVVEIFNAIQAADSNVSTKGVRAASSGATAGKYFKYGRIAAYLMYSPLLWSQSGSSPIWLRLKYIDDNGDWVDHAIIRDALGRMMIQYPSRLVEEDNSLALALPVPTMCEKAEVVSGMAAELLGVLRSLTDPVASIGSGAKAGRTSP